VLEGVELTAAQLPAAPDTRPCAGHAGRAG